jgi:hypothetical protein
MMAPRRWLKKQLPYVVGRKAIMVEVTWDGLTFWKKGKREKVFVPWSKVMPWPAFYTGDYDESQGLEAANMGGDDAD